MKLSKLLVATGIALSALGAQAQVVNGSFEANAQGNGTWAIYNNLVGWTGMTNIELRNNAAGTAQDGVNFVELDTNINMSIKQTLTNLAQSEYLLSFWYSARPQTSTATNGLSFSLGTFTGSVSPVANNTSNNIWQQYTAKVILSGNTDLKFTAIGTSDSYGTSLDNISVTAVPEPESYALMLAGLGFMGAIARRRNQSKAA